MNYPRVLVISNNSFSKSGANGRTLGSFFTGWPKERLAQFCLITNGPDFDLCNNYYCVTDISALKAFLTLGIPTRTIFNKSSSSSSSPISIKKNPKTPFRMLIRNVFWSFCRWRNRFFLEWVDSFAPEVLVVMNSDSFFILNIARSLAEYKKIPLVIFNTEGFYLFNKNYMWKGEMDSLFFPTYQCLYRHYFRRLMKVARFAIYANSLLKRDYDAIFKCDSIVLYTGTTIQYQKKDRINEVPRFSYLGNFGFKRFEVLIELSEILHEINPQYRLDVYGDAFPDIVSALENADYINFKGLIPYEKVLEVMHQSDILFHVENQDEKLQMSLKYGFTTKIADSISSGTLFCLYGPSEIACSRYIIETKAGLYADNKDEIKQKIIHALSDQEYRDEFIERGYAVSKMNHDLDTNANRFRDILEKVAYASNC